MVDLLLVCLFSIFVKGSWFFRTEFCVDLKYFVVSFVTRVKYIKISIKNDNIVTPINKSTLLSSDFLHLKIRTYNIIPPHKGLNKISVIIIFITITKK